MVKVLYSLVYGLLSVACHKLLQARPPLEEQPEIHRKHPMLLRPFSVVGAHKMDSSRLELDV